MTIDIEALIAGRPETIDDLRAQLARRVPGDMFIEKVTAEPDDRVLLALTFHFTDGRTIRMYVDTIDAADQVERLFREAIEA